MNKKRQQICANPNCDVKDCSGFVLYGDIVVCWICFRRIPGKWRADASRTGKNQGFPERNDCKTCDGTRIVGWITGSTPEDYDEHTESCPDC